MKKFLRFLLFFNVYFVGLFTFICTIVFMNWNTVTTENKWMFSFVFLGILCVFVGLNIYFFSMATSFEIHEEKIVFTYFNGKQQAVELKEIEAVFVAPQRYTFKTRSKKIYLSRQIGLIKIERDINPIISDTFALVIK